MPEVEGVEAVEANGLIHGVCQERWGTAGRSSLVLERLRVEGLPAPVLIELGLNELHGVHSELV